MQLVFIDDSGQRNPRRKGLGELVSIGAVMFPEEKVAGYTEKIAELRAAVGMPEDQEFKWSCPKGSFLARSGEATRKQLRRRMLEIAAECEVRTAVVIWDRSKLAWDRSIVANKVLTYLYERIEKHLKTMGQRGVVIADMPGGGPADQSKWLSDSLDLTTLGTRYTEPEQVAIPIVTAPSHHVPHIQLADLVTAATTAAFAGFNSGLELVDLLKPLARKNAYGNMSGVGVALQPAELMDLYFWVLGEESYWKRGTQYKLGPSGSPFAQPGRDFQKDDGMPE
ncbi:DUF3800 domain-containing protein [Streptomyces winkii]|uniref:DUF3800 domain-containing protein n=1 Tax=Streptomyces winkii TaxID=3051178 RepID=UPI0028D60EB3|nr:DUF3800 domain-containing protein [Streptomyces sp. DSM 40971]